MTSTDNTSKQLTVRNNLGEEYHLYQQSTMTTNKGKVTMHFFNKKKNFSPDTVQAADRLPKGYVIHEDPFTHRITCPPESAIDGMLVSVYKEQV